MLQAFNLISYVEAVEMTFELFIVTIGSFALGLFIVPLLGLSQTVELDADAATRAVVEVGEAIEVRSEDEGHFRG